MLNTWSYTRMATFEGCPFRAKLQYLDKIPDNQPKTAAERGTRVHTDAENFVQAGAELAPELEAFRPEMLRLRELYAEGDVAIEEDWGFTRDWEPTGFFDKNVWLRVKCDAVVFFEPGHVIIVDHKTGRKMGNEVKHTEQGQLYALAAVQKYPEIEQVTVEFWYHDQDDMMRTRYNHGQVMKLWPRYNERGLKVTDSTDFPAKPSVHACKWCPYGTGGTGHCQLTAQQPPKQRK